MNLLIFLEKHAFYVLVSASTIPVFFWMKEFKQELRIKYLWQYFAFLICIYGIGLLSTYGIAALENLINGLNLANRRGWSIFITMPLFYLLLAKITKRDINKVSDILGISVIMIYGFGRTACMFQGCCLGKFIPETQYRYPLVVIELLFLLIFLIIFGNKAYNRDFSGKSYPIFLIIYGIFRLFIELFREIDVIESYYGLFISCVLFILIGLLWLLRLNRLNRRNK